jgi:hypothetical protein
LGGKGRAEGVPTEMIRCTKMADDEGTAEEGRGSGARASSPCARNGTSGRPPVGASVALKAPAFLLSASPMTRSEPLLDSASAAASRGDAVASWGAVAGGGIEPGFAESRFGLGGGASFLEVGSTES